MDDSHESQYPGPTHLMEVEAKLRPYSCARRLPYLLRLCEAICYALSASAAKGHDVAGRAGRARRVQARHRLGVVLFKQVGVDTHRDVDVAVPHVLADLLGVEPH